MAARWLAERKVWAQRFAWPTPVFQTGKPCSLSCDAATSVSSHNTPALYFRGRNTGCAALLLQIIANPLKTKREDMDNAVEDALIVNPGTILGEGKERANGVHPDRKQEKGGMVPSVSLPSLFSSSLE